MPGPKPKDYTPILDAYLEGVPLKIIAHTHGCHHSNVNRVVRRAGLPFRKPRQENDNAPAPV